METFAFFFEAIFLGIYLYTWDRFENQKKHLLLLIPVAIGASFSAVFITMVNAFMNALKDLISSMVNSSTLIRSLRCSTRNADKSGACSRNGIYDSSICIGIDRGIPFIKRL